jgi:hypothetical protein
MLVPILQSNFGDACHPSGTTVLIPASKLLTALQMVMYREKKKRENFTTDYSWQF